MLYLCCSLKDMLYKRRMERQLAAARGEGPAPERAPDEVQSSTAHSLAACFLPDIFAKFQNWLQSWCCTDIVAAIMHRATCLCKAFVPCHLIRKLQSLEVKSALCHQDHAQPMLRGIPPAQCMSACALMAVFLASVPDSTCAGCRMALPVA